MKLAPFILEDAPHGPIRGDVYLPETPRGAPVVVACHGFKGFKNWGFWGETGRRMTEAGMVLATFNFSGSGVGEDLETFTEPERFEGNTISKEIEDLGIVLDAVTGRRVSTGDADARRLGVLGHSRGGGVALVRASRDPRVRSLVTWAAVASFDRFDEAARVGWRERGYLEVVNQRTGQVLRMGLEYLEDLDRHAEAYAPPQAVRRLRVPLLILHGTQDEAVPVEEAQLLARHADPGLGTLSLIQGAGHTFGAVHPFPGSTEHLDRVLDKTVAWFQETLS